jgi:aliphatic sulfonates family ABC transporter substrate-binding protein
MTSLRPSRRRAVLWAAAIGAVAAIAVIAAMVIDGHGPRRTPLRLAYQNRIGSALCIVAVEKRFFAAEDLRVEAMRFHSGPACSEALYCGAADVASMGDTTAVILASRRKPYTIVACDGAGEHRHRLMVKAGAAVRNAADLRGRTVAVKKGTSTYGGLLAYLAANGVSPSEVRIIDMGPSEMPDALLAGSIDAFVASEPTPSLAEIRGARQVATMGHLGNTYPLLLLARNELLAARPDDVRRLLRALRRAEQFVRDRPDETAEMLARATGLPSDVARRAMARHSYRLQLDDQTLTSLTRTAEFLRQQKQIDALPDFAAAASRDYLPANP